MDLGAIPSVLAGSSEGPDRVLEGSRTLTGRLLKTVPLPLGYENVELPGVEPGSRNVPTCGLASLSLPTSPRTIFVMFASMRGSLSLRDSNSNYRVQSPASYQLNEGRIRGPTVREVWAPGLRLGPARKWLAGPKVQR